VINALRERLRKLGLDNIDKKIERLMKEIIKNQSLITMEKI
jgi:hypothetical protein